MNRTRLAAFLVLLLLAACREPNGLPGDVPVAGTVATKSALPAQAPSRIDAASVEKSADAHLCNLEYVNDALFGVQDARVRGDFLIRGWLGDESGDAPGDPALVLVDVAHNAAYRLPLQRNLPRPDVADAYAGRADLASSGFELKVASAALPAGRFHLLLAYRVGDRLHTCDNGRQLQLSLP
jgi:hypothetical protein